MSFFVHQSSYVDEDVVIGEGTRIWHFCHVMPGARVGEGCNIGQNVFIDRDVRIGARCKIQNNVSVYRCVTLQDEVFLGPSCVFTNVRNPRSAVPTAFADYQPTLVKRGASIGANATIVCGVTIGAHAFVGAGAVVTKDVDDHAMMVGVPARRVGFVCRCGDRLDLETRADGPMDSVVCPCGDCYRLDAQRGAIHRIMDGRPS